MLVRCSLAAKAPPDWSRSSGEALCRHVRAASGCRRVAAPRCTAPSCTATRRMSPRTARVVGAGGFAGAGGGGSAAGRSGGGVPCAAVLSLPPSTGLRRSRLRLLLGRGAGAPAPGRWRLVQLLAVALPRLRADQTLAAAILAARERLPGGTLGAALALLQRPPCLEALTTRPHRVVELVQELAAINGSGFRGSSGGGGGIDNRDPAILNAMQQIARQLAERVAEFGNTALPLLCALAEAAGPAAFRRLSGDEAERLFVDVASHAGFLRPAVPFPSPPPLDKSPADAPPSPPLSTAISAPADPAPALAAPEAVGMAELWCAAARANKRCARLSAALSRGLAARQGELEAVRLPLLAFAIGRGEPRHDFILLHAMCRQAVQVLDELDNTSLVALMQAAARLEMHDEAFLDRAADRLAAGAAALAPGNIADTLYAFGTLQVRDPAHLNALCAALTPIVSQLTEPDIVRLLRGLVKLKHGDEGLLHALMPEVERQKRLLGPLSLSNIISALAYFGVTPEGFFRGLLDVATGRLHRMSSTSVQHVLTGLCRQQGRMHAETIREPLEAICGYLATPAVAAQLTPVQAIGALSALAKLQCRHLAAASVLLSSLTGRGGDVIWHWAPSMNFYAHPAAGGMPPSPFDEDRCLEHLRSSMDSSHLVEILQGVHRLDLHGALPLRLSRCIWEHLLQPQLHDLRAREIIGVARALGASRVAVGGAQEDAWKEHLARSCLESLRRHEHYLEAAWNTLLPFKLLCLEIDSGAFGSRRLDDILNPALLDFAHRLRQLTFVECEHTRILREAQREEREAVSGAGDGPACAALPGPGAGSALEVPTTTTGNSRMLSLPGYAGGFPVDVLIGAQWASDWRSVEYEV